MSILEEYLRELREIRSTGAGVDETSYYGPLERLLNSAGKALKPRVRCVMQLKNTGAGNPDGGLFTPDQFQRSSPSSTPKGELPRILAASIPSRGAIEVKGSGDNSWKTASERQVTKYFEKYRQVLVTNYRDFLLVGEDGNGEPIKLESYRLADSEMAFWTTPVPQLVHQHEERFLDFLKRILTHKATLATPEEVAWLLASYAREARYRIEEAELPALANIRAALEEALGLKFEGPKGEHFFRSTLVQTLFYGTFAAWVLWAKKRKSANRAAHFDWRTAAWTLRVPTIRVLFEQLVAPSKLQPLGLDEVLEWTGEALNRVNRQEFFERFEEEHAVQYFYEPFLQAFDPQLRKQLGVWYTPVEVVRYMVQRVDMVLREHLHIPDGLADPSVYILDPACGTGTYLVEVVRLIAQHLAEQGADALSASDLKRVVMRRVVGFEILPAPFVVAHLQLGLLLQRLGAPLSEVTNERASVYLTNSLTGWQPPTGERQPFLFAELEAERDAADNVKQHERILVVLGNPPYNAFSGVSEEEEHNAVGVYKQGLRSEWGIRKYNLDDLYVRFFRLAERRIAEQTGKGVVCYISPFSYLDDASFVVMRQRFCSEFDHMWFDSLNGDSRETGKLTPDGQPDPSIFSTEYNREGIRSGTAIGLMVRGSAAHDAPTVRFREFWGVNKRSELITSLDVENFDEQYVQALPEHSNRYSFRPKAVAVSYRSWPRIVDLCEAEPISGLQEMRRGAFMDVDSARLADRMRCYFDPTQQWSDIKDLHLGMGRDSGGFKAQAARTKLLSKEKFDECQIQRYALYPFDVRWCYYTTISPIWNRPRPELHAQVWTGNRLIITRMKAERPNEQIAITATSALPDYHLLRPNAVAIPIRLHPTVSKKIRRSKAGDVQVPLMEDESQLRANLSPKARHYLADLGIGDPDSCEEVADLIWMHSLAIGFSPAYMQDNSEGIQEDYPRIPLPADKSVLLASAALGRQLARLVDPLASLNAQDQQLARKHLRSVGKISRIDGLQIDPDRGELAVTCGWGQPGRDGIVMPGKGKAVSRDYSLDERAQLNALAHEIQISPETAFEALGQTTVDVYLNEVAYWSNVPTNVWDFTIGGYQVLKKWLSYRESKILHRPLSDTEAREVTAIIRRMCLMVLLEPDLDANYRTVIDNTINWPNDT